MRDVYCHVTTPTRPPTMADWPHSFMKKRRSVVRNGRTQRLRPFFGSSNDDFYVVLGQDTLAAYRSGYFPKGFEKSK